MSEKELLLSGFCHGVHHPQVSGFEVLGLLDTRSTLAGWEGELSTGARKELEEADRLFLKNAAQFSANIVQAANLAEMRQRAEVLPSHWWWYLDQLLTVDRQVS